jgi:ABC-type multidrug transport system ATPase subunit
LADQQKADERVDELIRDFSLQKCQNVYVGGKFIKGISGGEKKRVCIAVEVVNKPDLLILDEPTSGLDSYMANNILKIFNKLAKEGRTIIFTIHQPSYKIFTQLDRLLLLDKGECIYQGTVLFMSGLASGITEYMMSLNISIPANTTICDYFMFEISAYKENLKNEKTKLNSIAYS